MKYQFEVKTGDETGAGTDANIFVVLHGEYGQTAEERLNKHISGNAFERNQKDSFMVDMNQDVGRVYQIDLRSDCKYSGSDWRLAYIKVTRLGDENDADSNFTSTFHINKWINNQSTKSYVVNYDDWTNEIKYETYQEDYKKYLVNVPPRSTYVYKRRETTTTNFFYENVKSKKTTKEFNMEMGSSSSLSATAGIAEGLSATAASSKFLKFAFSHGFESYEMNRLTKTENFELMEEVSQELYNDTDAEQVYEARFSIIKVKAISRLNGVVALFSANSEIEFTGFRLVSPK